MQAIQAGDYESFKSGQTAIEAHAVELDRKIKETLDRLEALNKRHAEIISFRDRVVIALSKSPSANYFNRRMEADKFISDPLVRTRVFESSGYKCVRCKTTRDLSIDHIMCVKDGGSDAFDNLQTLCKRCNSSKGSKSLADFWPTAQ